MAHRAEKPHLSYANLITIALKQSPNGRLPVSEIFNIICERFPYFNTAPPGWMNSIRHNLALNKNFGKVEGNLHGRKTNLWFINPEKMDKMEADLQKNLEGSGGVGEAQNFRGRAIHRATEPSSAVKLAWFSFSRSATASADKMVPRAEKLRLSYANLITIALKQSPNGRLPVSEIFNIICERFPYFHTALPGWKNSIRHNLFLNRNFLKIEIDDGSLDGRKYNLWFINPETIKKMEADLQKNLEGNGGVGEATNYT